MEEHLEYQVQYQIQDPTHGFDVSSPLSYTRIIGIEESEERPEHTPSLHHQQLQHPTNYHFRPLHPGALDPSIRRNDTLPRRLSEQEQERDQRATRMIDPRGFPKSDGGGNAEEGIGKKRAYLKSIQQNELEYKKSDESLKSMLEKQLLGHHIIAGNRMMRRPALLTSHSQPIASNAVRMSTYSKNPTSEEVCFRRIEDSLLDIRDSRNNREHRAPAGFLTKPQETDRETLRLVREVSKKSLMLSQSPAGRDILSSLTTSRRQYQRFGVDDERGQRQYSADHRVYSDIPTQVVSKIFGKLIRLQRLLANLKVRKSQNRQQVLKSSEVQKRLILGEGCKKKSNGAGGSEGLFNMDSILSMSESRLEALLHHEVWRKDFPRGRSNYRDTINYIRKIAQVFEIYTEEVQVVFLNEILLIAQLHPQLPILMCHQGNILLRNIFYPPTSSPQASGLELRPHQYVYSGQFVELADQTHLRSYRHGQGTILYDNGTLYQGEWLKGTFHGKGILKSPTGDIYRGQFKEGLKNGYGEEHFANGDNYSGEFLKNIYHGRGNVFPKKVSITGKMAHFFKENSNLAKCTDKVSGFQKIGQFRYGLKEGWGVYTWKNGRTFQGRFKKGKIKLQNSYMSLRISEVQNEFEKDWDGQRKGRVHTQKI